MMCAPCIGGPLDGDYVPVEPNQYGVLWGRWMVGPVQASMNDNADELWPTNMGSAIRADWGGDYRLYHPLPGEPVVWTWRPADNLFPWLTHVAPQAIARPSQPTLGKD